METTTGIEKFNAESRSFTAIDFETAHGKRWSVCQVGLVKIENGYIKDRLAVLIKPPKNFYWDRFSEIHGITPQKTAMAPTFDRVWSRIKPFIENQHVVAHNGFAFDFHCLNQTLEYYNIKPPIYTGHCTYKIYKDNLASLCKVHDIPFTQHTALSDAFACAELYQLHLMKNNFRLE